VNGAPGQIPAPAGGAGSYPAGLVILDKPSGMTSRAAVDAVMRFAHFRQAGHCGTLDPLATGVLVVCLGWATRLAGLVQQFAKRYRAGVLLGVTSDTDDVTGRVEPVAAAQPPPRDCVERQARTFLGAIQQVPPAYSARHDRGRRAYWLARRGLPVALPAREVHVYQIEVSRYDYPRLELLIECGRGTYVRALARDLGRLLGTGACLESLVRERVGPFGLDRAATLADLQSRPPQDWLVPPLEAVAGLPRRACTQKEARDVAQGRPIPLNLPVVDPEQPVALVDEPGLALLAIARCDPSHGLLRPRSVFAKVQTLAQGAG